KRILTDVFEWRETKYGKSNELIEYMHQLVDLKLIERSETEKSKITLATEGILLRTGGPYTTSKDVIFGHMPWIGLQLEKQATLGNRCELERYGWERSNYVGIYTKEFIYSPNEFSSNFLPYGSDLNIEFRKIKK
ncbi:MAG: hypothetical protein ABIO02_04865, partial [Patescibacteria group bacterium]